MTRRQRRVLHISILSVIAALFLISVGGAAVSLTFHVERLDGRR